MMMICPRIAALLLMVFCVTATVTHRLELETCIVSFDVKTDMIIRTNASQSMGGQFLDRADLGSREECLRLCCETDDCDVFVYDEREHNTCYLFRCGPAQDFRCKFTRHANYTSAVLTPPVVRDTSVVEQAQMPPQMNVVKQTIAVATPPLRPNPRSEHEIELSMLMRKGENRAAAAAVVSTAMPAVAAISAAVHPTMKSTCGRFQFQCHSGECIAVYNACDGIPQCVDGSDEGPECPSAATVRPPSSIQIAAPAAAAMLIPSKPHQQQQQQAQQLMASNNAGPAVPFSQAAPSYGSRFVAQYAQPQANAPANVVVHRNREDPVWPSALQQQHQQQQQQQQQFAAAMQQQQIIAGELQPPPSPPQYNQDGSLFTAGGDRATVINPPSSSGSAAAANAAQSNNDLAQRYLNANIAFQSPGSIQVPSQQQQQQQQQFARSGPYAMLQPQQQQQQQPSEQIYRVPSPWAGDQQQSGGMAAAPWPPQQQQSQQPAQANNVQQQIATFPQQVAVPQQTQQSAANVAQPSGGTAAQSPASSADDSGSDSEADDSDAPVAPPAAAQPAGHANRKKPHKHNHNNQAKKPEQQDVSAPVVKGASSSASAAHAAHHDSKPAHEQLRRLKTDLDMEFLDHDGAAERPGGAVLSLTLGVIVTAALAVLVGCRANVVRRRVRGGRREGKGAGGYAHEADFLVNGMYL